MGPEGAVDIIFRKEIGESEDPAATRERLIEEYRNNFASPFRAAELGYIDQIIFPENTQTEADTGADHARGQAGLHPAETARQHPVVKGSKGLA